VKGCRLDLSGWRQGHVADCCEHGNNAGTVVVVERLNLRRNALDTMRIHAIQELVLHCFQCRFYNVCFLLSWSLFRNVTRDKIFKSGPFYTFRRSRSHIKISRCQKSDTKQVSCWEHTNVRRHQMIWCSEFAHCCLKRYKLSVQSKAVLERGNVQLCLFHLSKQNKKFHSNSTWSSIVL